MTSFLKGSWFTLARRGTALHTTTPPHPTTCLSSFRESCEYSASFIALQLGRQMNDTRNTTEQRREERVFVSPPNLLLRYLRARPPPCHGKRRAPAEIYYIDSLMLSLGGCYEGRPQILLPCHCATCKSDQYQTHVLVNPPPYFRADFTNGRPLRGLCHGLSSGVDHTSRSLAVWSLSKLEGRNRDRGLAVISPRPRPRFYHEEICFGWRVTL